MSELSYASNADLKDAAAEIKAVLKKYDLAAMITLQSRTHVEFVRELSPTWSCMFFEDGPDGEVGIRFRAKREHFPSVEAQKEAVERTLGLLFGFKHQAEMDVEQMNTLLKTFAPHFQQVTNWLGPVRKENP